MAFSVPRYLARWARLNPKAAETLALALTSGGGTHVYLPMVRQDELVTVRRRRPQCVASGAAVQRS